MKELTIHCLKCDDTYLEAKDIIKICPHCGNPNMLETVYLCSEGKQ